MAANLSSNASSSKATASASSNLSSGLAQSGPVSGGENQRRSGGSGSFGAGATTRAVGAAPRKQQASRNQSKYSRRYRFPDEDAIAESAAMNSTRNRKGQTSITHLMNFSLPPRPSNYQHFHNPRHVKRNPTWGLGSGYHAVDKARYVHANYRFIVDPSRDYHAQSIDADVYLDWNSIMQVLASPQSQAAACPICLGDPVAPRMAKCGHIFCLHCLIRYMHSSDDVTPLTERKARWKKCPICEDSIYLSETRPLRWYIGQEGEPPREHEDIVLRLVMRPAGSTLALPGDTQPMGKDEEIPWHFAVDVMDFARVMKGSRDYMMAQFDDELTQIEELERHDELMFGEDSEWTSRAARAVKDAKEKAKELRNPPSQSAKPDDQKFRKRAAASGGVSLEAPEMYVFQHSAQSGQSLPLKHDSSSSHHLSVSNGDAFALAAPANSSSTSISQHSALQHSHNNPPSDYFFYQALLHHYLSPLDIKILKAAFGEFAQFPSTILPRIEHVSTGHVVDDELRRRTKYLSHLPHGCEVSFLECDWTDTVSPEVLERFKGDIERRRKRNEEKETREERERVKAERAEEAKGYAAARRKRPLSPVERFKPDDFEPLATIDNATHSGRSVDVHGGQESTSPMWRQGGSGFASLASPGTSPSTARTVWGTNVVVPSSPDVLPLDLAPGPPQEDGWLQDWERDLLAEEELIARTEQTSLEAPDLPATAKGSSGKKKKGKKITLMSTNARRGA